MKRQLANTICGLEFAMKKNDFERLKYSSGKSEMTLLPTQYIPTNSFLNKNEVHYSYFDHFTHAHAQK